MEISFNLCHLSQLEALTYTAADRDKIILPWAGTVFIYLGTCRELCCWHTGPRDGDAAGKSPVLIITPETMEVSWEGLRTPKSVALVVLALPSMQGITGSTSLAQPGSHPRLQRVFSENHGEAPGCHPQSKALFQTHGFYCLSGFLKDQPETFLALSCRSEAAVWLS